MNSIENYKKRFNMLMESSLGDVRPLINEDQSKLQPVQQQVNLAVQEMNKAINDYAKQQQPPTQLPNIKISKSQQSVPVKAADGSQTNVNIDSYGFDLNGKQPKTGINFSRTTDPAQYKNFQIEWNSSLSDVNWLMNVGAGNVGRNLANPLKAISDKYLNVVMGLLNQKPTQPGVGQPTQQPVAQPKKP